MSASDALAMFWRVKKWRISLEVNGLGIPPYGYSTSREVSVLQKSFYRREVITLFPEPGEPFIIPFAVETIEEGPTLTDSLDTQLGRTANEKDLVCRPPTASAEFSYVHFGLKERVQADMTDVISAAIGIASPTLMEVDLGWILQDENFLQLQPAFFVRETEGGAYEYAPNLFLTCTALYVDVLLSPIPGSSNVYRKVGTLSFSFLGKEFSTDIMGDTGPLTEFEMNVSVNAIEYWPYDPGDGDGPIYDSATGEQLRPFPA
jgi:hypothetical protein